MKSSFIVFINAIEKRSDARNIHVSVFFNQKIMYESIGKCVIQCSIMISAEYSRHHILFLKGG